MTLEEAIIQFKEDADNNRADIDMEWAEENEQVAKRLEELKAIKEGVVFYSNRPIEDIVLEARAEAIDEFVNLYEKWTKLEKPQQAYYWTVVLCKLKEIAEQLKEKNNAID